MRRILAFFILLAACQPVPKASEESYLFKIEDQEVSPEEFLYAYKKNKIEQDSIALEEDVRDYLDLYINFKLKVLEAKKMGLDTLKTYRTELEGYRKQLAAPYLTETAVTEQLIKEAYERMKEEIRASHILIQVTPEASPEDTLKAYQRTEEIRNRTLQGEDFAELAYQFSQDPSAKSNRGDLGYFTSLQMVYPFEEAAFNTQKGEISSILRTRFGYHILKVTDRRAAQGQVKVSHIMIRASDNLSSRDSLIARSKIGEIRAQILKGNLSWKEACNQFSEDVNTSNTGGSLPWLGSGNLPPDFEEAAFGMDSTGQISSPVKTPFGWHIIKLDGKRGLDTFENMRPSLESRIKRDSRSELSEKAFIDKIKKENEFKEVEGRFQLALDYLDSTLLDARWAGTDTLATDTLFTIKDQLFIVNDLLTYIKKNQRISRGMDIEVLGKQYYEDFKILELKKYEEDQLADKYFEYRMLYQEYAEGIILFQLMDTRIWSKAVKDTAGLRNYYETHTDKYMGEEKVSGTLYNLANDSLRLVLQDMIERQDNLIQSKSDLKYYFNEKSSLNLLITEGPIDVTHPVLEKISEKTPGIYNLDLDGRFYLVDMDSLIGPQPKSMNEVRGRLISDYQEFLEDEWIRELRNTYPVNVNEKLLENTILELENR